MLPMTNKEKKAQLTALLAALQKEVKDYVKAKRGEMRSRPVYLAKDSDVCVDRMSDAFRRFVSETYRN